MANFIEWKAQQALGQDRNVDQRRKQGSVLRGIELDLHEDQFDLRQTPLRRYLRTPEPGAAPFDDWVQRRVLQELRRTPFDPGARGFAKPGVKLFDQPGLADAGLAADQDELSFARTSALPAPGENSEVLLAADKGRGNPGALPAASAAYAQDAIERHWRRYALELMRAPVLRNEKPGHLPLNRRSDQHGARLGHRLNTRGDIGRLAEHFARRVDDYGAAFKADAGD